MAAVEIRDLAVIDPADEAVFGGKACGLAHLRTAGARVPAGFVVSATTLPPECWPAAARAEFLRAAEALLSSGMVAVRSSAPGEDSAARSFAGLFESFLGRRQLDEVEQATRACIASGGASRVLEYAGAQKPLPVATVVQRQIGASAAGVCFTRDPAGRDAAVVVEAVGGTGDRLVSGQAEPERWRVYRTGLGTWDCRREAGRGVLDLARAQEIASEARRLEAAFGRPLDLEWAYGENGLWWLQARPITALREPPSYDVAPGAEATDDGPVTVWSNWNVRETMPSPLSPLTWSLWRDVILPTVTHHLFGVRPGSPEARLLFGLDLVAGRPYFNVNGMLAPPAFGGLLLRAVGAMDSRAAASLRQLRDAGVLRPRRLPGHAPARAARALLASLRGLARLGVALRPRAALATLFEDAARIAARPPLAGLSDRQLLDELRLMAKPECGRLLFGLQMEAVAIAVYSLARHAFARHERAAQLLGAGIPANPTTRISLAIDELVALARPLAGILGEQLTSGEALARVASVPEGEPFVRRLESFLADYGHRGPTEFDLGAARWGEEPAMILDLVRLGLASPPDDTVGGRIAALGGERSLAIAQAVAGEPRWRRPLLRLLARLVELYMPLREAPKHCGLVIFQRMRQAALELGVRLARHGLLRDPGDVFMLELDELELLAQGHPVTEGLAGSIAERRARLARWNDQRPPDILRSDGVPVGEGFVPKLEQGVLAGTPISAGTGTGPVRILTTPDPRLVTPGDVLVMEFADPGWTPLFPRASAVVMEIGGLMCHAAVVAREMGVPAVFGVAAATRRLANGQQVVVDGGAGTVRLVEAADQRAP